MNKTRTVVLIAALACASCMDEPAAKPNPAAIPAAAPTPPSVTEVQSKPSGAMVKAAPGVGEKGSRLGDGFVSTPVKAYFHAKEVLAFATVIHAVEIYKGLNGHPPKTVGEFNEQIIKLYQLELPELPPGSRYVYDPKTGELLVEHPQQSPQATRPPSD